MKNGYKYPQVKFENERITLRDMSNNEILEYMKERFDQVAISIKEMEKGRDGRLKNIEREIKPLIEYKAQSEGSMVVFKYLVGFGFAVMTIVLSLVTVYLNNK